MMAYLWNDSGSDAEAVPDGRVYARGTPHDVPNEDDCRACHLGVNDVVLGFSALQLATAESGETLANLAREGWLSHTPPAIQLPGDNAVRDALGYLHANCGSCHRPNTGVALDQTPLDLWLDVHALDTVARTPTYLTSVGQPAQAGDDAELSVIEPGNPEGSALWLRMATRDRRAMPPLASKLVHRDGLSLVEQFILRIETR
jgi:hypothetical protein